MTISDDAVRRLIDLRHAGQTWAQIADVLDCTLSAIKAKAQRLRDAGLWQLADGTPADGAPAKGKLGRPRNDVPSIAVSLRFSPDACAALHAIAEASGLRLGEVVSAALERATQRVQGQDVSAEPFGLDPGAVAKLGTDNRTETISVNVPAPVYAAFMAIDQSEWSNVLARRDQPPNTLIAAAVDRLLLDLNYIYESRAA